MRGRAGRARVLWQEPDKPAVADRAQL